MSDIELWSGKIVKVNNPDNLTFELMAKQIMTNNNVKFDNEDWRDYWLNYAYKKYVELKGEIWKIEAKQHGVPYGAMTDSSTMDFIVSFYNGSFYNGSTCLAEAIEDVYNEVNKNV